MKREWTKTNKSDCKNAIHTSNDGYTIVSQWSKFTVYKNGEELAVWDRLWRAKEWVEWYDERHKDL